MLANVYNTTRSVFQFLGLDFHPQVQKYLNKHSNYESGLRLNSSGTSFSVRLNTLILNTKATSWIKGLQGNSSVVLSIQKACSEAIRLWGYNFLTVDDIRMYNNKSGPTTVEKKIVL